MRKSAIFAVLALGSFLAILFNPTGTNYWIYFLIAGIIFGIIWLAMRR